MVEHVLHGEKYWEPLPTQAKGFLQLSPLTSPQTKQMPSVKMNWCLLLNQQMLEGGKRNIKKKEENYMCIFS